MLQLSFCSQQTHRRLQKYSTIPKSDFIFTCCNFQQPVGLLILSTEDLFLLNQWATSLTSREAEALNESQSLCNIKSLIAENQISLLWQNSDEEDGCMGYNRLKNRFIVYVSIQKNLLYASLCSYGKRSIDFLVSIL